MTDCDKYAGLISRYIDGELTGQEKSELEEHLAACASCASLLTLYREISAAAADAPAPPEDFATNVMARVRAARQPDGRDAGVPSGKRKPRPLVTILAAAACLALLLTAAPLVLKLAPKAGSSAASMKSAVAAPSDTDITYAGQTPISSASGSALPNAAAGGSAADTGTEDDAGTTQAPSQQQGRASSKSAYTAKRSAQSDEAAPDTSKNAQPQNDANGGTDLQDSVSPTPETGDTLRAFAASAPEPSVSPAYNLGAYYAVITVTGELPDSLKDAKKTAESDGTYRIEISAETASQLIRDGYPAEEGNQASQTALVVYVPE